MSADENKINAAEMYIIYTSGAVSGAWLKGTTCTRRRSRGRHACVRLCSCACVRVRCTVTEPVAAVVPLLWYYNIFYFFFCLSGPLFGRHCGRGGDGRTARGDGKRARVIDGITRYASIRYGLGPMITVIMVITLSAAQVRSVNLTASVIRPLPAPTDPSAQRYNNDNDTRVRPRYVLPIHRGFGPRRGRTVMTRSGDGRLAWGLPWNAVVGVLTSSSFSSSSSYYYIPFTATIYASSPSVPLRLAMSSVDHGTHAPSPLANRYPHVLGPARLFLEQLREKKNNIITHDGMNC